ncbi:YitT family protein [Erysipelotrichaceae bacterium OttesenSCG-928-M19]|nr:YitT family protein [Erysipelotrichaceae bacterium OttesenSCG-928-M19]
MTNILKHIFGVALGIFLICLAVNTMFAPHQVAAGGVGGISTIFFNVFQINMALTALVINSVLLVVGLILLGKSFFIKTAYGALLFPLFIELIPKVPLSNDILLSVLFGSLLTAMGVNILYYLDASSGGTTVPPLILKKYFGINPSLGLFITDALVVISSLFIFGVQQFMYAALVIMLTSIIMEYLTSGLTRKKVVYIISEKQDLIAAELMNNIGRGATRLLAQGAYTSEERNVLMIVLNDRDFNKLQKIIADYDPQAFVIIHNVSKVLGQGFTYHSVVQ